MSFFYGCCDGGFGFILMYYNLLNGKLLVNCFFLVMGRDGEFIILNIKNLFMESLSFLECYFFDFRVFYLLKKEKKF